jgi:hypothetical protein
MSSKITLLKRNHCLLVKQALVPDPIRELLQFPSRKLNYWHEGKGDNVGKWEVADIF